MTDRIVTLKPEGRWHVPVSDEGHWRMGVYTPESSSPAEITILEKHSCPELFVCMKGRMGLLTGSGKEEKIIELDPDQAVLVDDYHNGYSIDPSGYFLVIERTSFTTEYIDRKTLEVIDRRVVG